VSLWPIGYNVLEGGATGEEKQKNFAFFAVGLNQRQPAGLAPIAAGLRNPHSRHAARAV